MMNKNSAEIVAILLAVVVAILVVAFVPLTILWALNTLFPVLAIPYSFWHWLAVVVLNLTWLYKPSIKKSSSD